MKHPLTEKKQAKERLIPGPGENQFQLFDDLLISQSVSQLNFLKKLHLDKDLNPSLIQPLKDLITVRQIDLERRIYDLHVLSMSEAALLPYFNSGQGES